MFRGELQKWIKENGVLEIVLRDSLHQPQYVEKLEKILRFIIKERTLTLEDLDAVWAAQAGKHEAIVKNVHDLLAKLAWDFSPEQLDHLFECFQVRVSMFVEKSRNILLLCFLSLRKFNLFREMIARYVLFIIYLSLYLHRRVGRLPIKNNGRNCWNSYGDSRRMIKTV